MPKGLKYVYTVKVMGVLESGFTSWVIPVIVLGNTDEVYVQVFVDVVFVEFVQVDIVKSNVLNDI